MIGGGDGSGGGVPCGGSPLSLSDPLDLSLDLSLSSLGEQDSRNQKGLLLRGDLWCRMVEEGG